jgi:AraC-like DNA-binding protein
MNFADPEQFQEAVQPAHLHVVVTGRGRFEANLAQIKLDSLWMQHGQFSLPAVVHSVVPADRRMFFLQFDAAQAPIVHSGTQVAPDEIVCYPLDSEHHYRTSTSYRCGGMSLTEVDFTAYEQALLGHAQPAPSAIRVVRPQPHLMSRLLKLHKAVTDLVTTAPDIVLHPKVERAIEQELARAMIACLADPGATEAHRPSPHRLSVMARFEQILQAQPDEALHVTEICAGIGISERTLRLHCQEQLGMSPHRYLWVRRMNLVRCALARAEPASKTVTEIANDYGFPELGRFAVSYRELFGESPSVTLRQRPRELSHQRLGSIALNGLE